jgi:hypothetical protein
MFCRRGDIGEGVMADQDWTPSLVEERLVEAADVLKRLPDDGCAARVL